MSTHRFAIVGFDLDGTLLDTSGDLGASLNHVLGQIGRPPVPTATVANLIGGGARPMLQRGLELTGGDEGIDKEALFQDLLAYYQANIAVHTAFYPGAEAMLDALDASDTRIAVVTNKREFMARRLFDELGLTHRFASIIGAGRFPLKPEPDALHAMVEECGGGAAAFVGDTTYDMGAARAAGMPSVAVSFGFCNAPPQELGADVVIDHFDALIPALSRL